jgi:hypothetical protein
MGDAVTPEGGQEPWPQNYFNYFTEIEEHFQRARGTCLFLLSPLDWALIETWKNSGIPLEAVLRGIDAAFVKWRGRKSKTQQVNSLAFCTQAVMEETRVLANQAPATPPKEVDAPFSISELAGYLQRNAAQLRETARPAFLEIAISLDQLAETAAEHIHRLEDLEMRLTTFEDKLLAISRSEQTDDDLFQARKELESYLKPYRGKMTAPQLSMLEKQFLDRWLLEKTKVPRLSLFYLR